MLTREWRPAWPLDMRRTLSPLRRGARDPAYRITPDGAVWRASMTPDGPGALRLTISRSDGVVAAAAWGPGATWLLEGVPELLGGHDDPASFEPQHPALRTAAVSMAGLRIGRTRRVFEALVPSILEQKVVSAEAWRAWRYLLLTFGERAPGPGGLRVPPPPRVWARIPSWEWHRAGVEAVRARAIAGAARVADRLEVGDGPLPGDRTGLVTASEVADRRLRSLPGIGPWTSAEVRQRALGDSDAVSVGDYHLPGVVGWALAGRKVDDAGMLELLAPYAGHRYRVTRLLELARKGPPRRGPRMPVRDYRAF